MVYKAISSERVIQRPDDDLSDVLVRVESTIGRLVKMTSQKLVLSVVTLGRRTTIEVRLPAFAQMIREGEGEFLLLKDNCLYKALFA